MSGKITPANRGTDVKTFYEETLRGIGGKWGLDEGSPNYLLVRYLDGPGGRDRLQSATVASSSVRSIARGLTDFPQLVALVKTFQQAVGPIPSDPALVPGWSYRLAQWALLLDMISGQSAHGSFGLLPANVAWQEWDTRKREQLNARVVVLEREKQERAWADKAKAEELKSSPPSPSSASAPLDDSLDAKDRESYSEWKERQEQRDANFAKAVEVTGKPGRA